MWEFTKPGTMTDRLASSVRAARCERWTSDLACARLNHEGTRQGRARIEIMSLAWALDRRSILKLGLVGACAALRDVVRVRRASAQGAPAIDQRERHLTNLRQLTFGGQNAEAYFDRAGTRLVFQSTRPPFDCDQIFTMRDDGSEARLVSTGRGR